MATKGRTVRFSGSDDHVVTDHPDKGRLEALHDQNLFHRIRSERAASYWFAASLWGMSGLVIGALMGAFFMYASTQASLPLALEAQSQAIAQERGRQAADDRHRLVTEGESAPSSQQQP